MSRRQNTASTTSTNKTRRRAYTRKAATTAAVPPRAPPRRRVVRKPRQSKNYFGESVGGGIGGMVAGPAGQALGSKIGKGAQQMFRAITGWGDYEIKGNSLMTGGMTPPQIINSIDRGGYIVRHREFLGDVLATTAFSLSSYRINPGVSTFPWLSCIADSFEEYKFRGLIFEFKSTSSDAVLSTAASSALGTVIMATEYNVLNPNFPNKVSMENYEFANSAKPSECFYHPIECKANLTPISQLYVRSTPVPSGADARLYDLGNFQIATVGMQAAGGIIGELWVTYEIELYKPKYSNGANIYTDHFNLSGITDAAAFGTTSLDFTKSLQTAAGGGWSNNGTLIGGNSYAFPPNIGSGNFLVTICYNFTAEHGTAIGTLSTFGCTTLQYWQGDSQFNNYTTAVAVSDSQFITLCYVIKVYEQNAGFSLSGMTFFGTFSNGDLWVTQISPSINS